MQSTPKQLCLVVCAVDLGAAAEATLHAEAEAVGGRALDSEMAEAPNATLGVLGRMLVLLEALDVRLEPNLTPIIQDRLPA